MFGAYVKVILQIVHSILHIEDCMPVKALQPLPTILLGQKFNTPMNQKVPFIWSSPNRVDNGPSGNLHGSTFGYYFVDNSSDIVELLYLFERVGRLGHLFLRFGISLSVLIPD